MTLALPVAEEESRKEYWRRYYQENKERLAAHQRAYWQEQGAPGSSEEGLQAGEQGAPGSSEEGRGRHLGAAPTGERRPRLGKSLPASRRTEDQASTRHLLRHDLPGQDKYTKHRQEVHAY